MIPPVRDPSVQIDSRQQGTSVHVKFTGTLAHRDPGPVLKPFFDELHARVVKEGCTEARVDLRELKFMNSSSFKHFITWVKANNELPPGQRYKLVFILSPAHHWQKVSIHALSCFAKDGIEAVVGALP